MTERNETPTEQMMNAPCVNCGERAAHHGSAGRALICQRQRYYAPTLDHPNAAETIHTLRSTVATLTQTLATETAARVRLSDALAEEVIRVATLTEQLRERDDLIETAKQQIGEGLIRESKLRAARDAALAKAARLREGWTRGRWWRVLTPEGKLWCETSDEQGARDIAAEKGWPLENLWVNIREEWRTEPASRALSDPPKGE